MASLRLIVTLTLISLTLSMSSAHSRTTRVHPGVQGAAPIQAAIDAASNGDSIIVESGQYTESIDFKGKVVALIGSGNVELTGSSASVPVVRIAGGQSRSAVLSGFRITGGIAGVQIVSAEPTISHNVIEGNGAGIWCVANSGSWRPLLTDNVIHNNESPENGGGIGVRNYMFPEIVNNEITGNEGEDGGGIWISGASDGCVIRANKITNNYARDHGGGIYVALSTAAKPTLILEISGNVIAGNIAVRHSLLDYAGGGVWLASATAWIHHNTIVNNTGFATGNGIAIVRSGNSTIEQNIMAFNSNGDGVWCVEGARPTAIRDNLVWPGFGGVGGGACDEWWTTNANILDDPHFCNLAGNDYSVTDISAALVHPAGPLGAISAAGCTETSIEPSTWGRIKSREW